MVSAGLPEYREWSIAAVRLLQGMCMPTILAFGMFSCGVNLPWKVSLDGLGCC